MWKIAFVFVCWIITVRWLFPAHAIFLSFLGAGWIGIYQLESTKKFFITHSFALSVPFMVTYYFYNHHFNAWWLADDPALLQAIVEHGIFPHFYASEVWRQVSPANLTPWLIASLGIDWYLFQLDPFGYYLHHFLSFFLVLSVSYIFLNHYFSPVVTSFVLSLLVLSTPIANLLQFLMVRHYLEGLGLAIAALLFYLKALRTQQQRWLWLSSVGYLLAITAKEIYVPLVVLLLFFPESTGRKRINYLIPLAIIALMYVLWRAEMLQWQRLISGYDSSLVPKLTMAYVYNLPQRFLNSLGWLTTWQITIFSTVFVLFWIILLQQARSAQIIFILVLIALVALPIIPVLTILDTRYLVLPYFLLCISFGWSLQFLRMHTPSVIPLSLGLALIAASVQAISSLSFNEMQQRYRAEGEFILRGDAGTLLQPMGMYWYYQGLQQLRTKVLHLPDSTHICYDPCACALSAPMYRYQADQLKIDTFSENHALCISKNQTLPTVTRLENDILFWQLKHCHTGQYFASLSKNNKLHGQFFPIPATGQFAVVAKKVTVVFKYVSATGETIYSPVIEVTARPPPLP